VLGAPAQLALRALPPAERGRVARPARSALARAAMRPTVVGGVFLAVMVASHVPALYDAALGSSALHALQHGLYFWSGVAFWAIVLDVGPLPRRASPLGRVLLLLATMPPMALVGVTIASAQDVVYDHYADQSRALADQGSAGTLMWLGGTVPLGAVALALGWRALRLEDDRQLARERRLEARAGTGRVE
jgi:putative membrane protein